MKQDLLDRARIYLFMKTRTAPSVKINQIQGHVKTPISIAKFHARTKQGRKVIGSYNNKALLTAGIIRIRKHKHYGKPAQCLIGLQRKYVS